MPEMDESSWTPPPDDVWNRHCRAGELAMRKAVTKAALEQLEHSPAGAVGVSIGAIVGVGEIMRAVSPAEGLESLERLALAYLRGALRGLAYPVAEDGTPLDPVAPSPRRFDA